MKWLITLKLAFCLAAAAIVTLTLRPTSGQSHSDETELMLLPYVGFLAYTFPFYLVKRLRHQAAESACVTAFLAFGYTVACCAAVSSSALGGVVLFFAPTILWTGMLTLFLIGLCVAWYRSRLRRRADL